MSGPYAKSLSSNKSIIGIVDWFTGCPEAFPIPDKDAESVAHLLLEEIIARYSTPLQTVNDNGTENVNQLMKHTFEILNISHITTSFPQLQGNAKVE